MIWEEPKDHLDEILSELEEEIPSKEKEKEPEIREPEMRLSEEREELPAEKEKPKIRVRFKEKKKRRTQMIIGIIGGIILFIMGATGSVAFYEKVIEYAIQYNALPPEYQSFAVEALNILRYLAMSGGLTVIVGVLMIPKIRRLGSWLIGIGAGISLVSLLTKIFFLGPIIQQYVSQSTQNISYLYEALRIFGIEIGFLGLGVLLSFMATFEVYRWTITLGVASLLYMLAGLSGDPRLLEYIKDALSVPPELGIYVDHFLMLLIYVGPLLLVAALLAGAGYIKISKIIVILCLVSGIFPTISVFLDISSIVSYVDLYAILQYIRLTSIIGVYVCGIYFLKKA